jgi:hypothetical protein
MTISAGPSTHGVYDGNVSVPGAGVADFGGNGLPVLFQLRANALTGSAATG